MPQFHGQVVWITGASAGIGRALALEFARRGADVAVSARRVDRLAEVVDQIDALGRHGLAVPCDVTDDADVARAVDAVLARFGRLDVAVANAGFGVVGRLEDLSDADLRRQFDTNVFGAMSTARHALPALRRTRGRLALVSSVAGLLASPRTGAYTASKFALRGLGLTLAQELHAAGVSCTLLNPGFVATEIAQVDNAGRFDGTRPDKRPGKLMWTSEAAARVMATAIYRRRLEYTFTAHGKLGKWLGQHMPGLVHLLMRGAKSPGVVAEG
jgi:NAD(P)-dependent dehydrogenase (short-subunit alcohol dehydrogenase family)